MGTWEENVLSGTYSFPTMQLGYEIPYDEPYDNYDDFIEDCEYEEEM